MRALNPELRGDVTIVQWPDVDAEIEGVVAGIVADVESNEYREGDILVLTQRRKIGIKIARRLRELDIAASSFYNQEVIDGDKRREALATLRLALGDDRSALRVILGLGSSDGRRNAYRRIAGYASKHGITERQVLERMLAGERLGLNANMLASRYQEVKNRIEKLNLEDLHELVDHLFSDPDDPQDDLHYIASECADVASDADDLLGRIVVRISQEDVPTDPNFVRVMSLHKSKGLTSKVAYVVGTVDGILPGRSAVETEADAEYEEGRRLFYVALSRAEKKLVISHFREISLAEGLSLGLKSESPGRSGTIRTVASPYLSELGSASPVPVAGPVWLQGISKGG